MDKAVTNLTGAAAAGMAVAVWYTHAGEAWTPVEISALGAGIGAVLKYAVGWLDMLRPAKSPEE